MYVILWRFLTLNAKWFRPIYISLISHLSTNKLCISRIIRFPFPLIAQINGHFLLFHHHVNLGISLGWIEIQMKMNVYGQKNDIDCK